MTTETRLRDAILCKGCSSTRHEACIDAQFDLNGTLVACCCSEG